MMKKEGSMLSSIQSFNPTKTIRNNINLMALIVFFIMGMIASDRFLTMSNMLNVFTQISINGVLAAGFTMVCLSGGFDLSLGSTVSVTAVLFMGLQRTHDISVAIGVAVVAGVCFGLFNGTLLKVVRGDLGDTFLITLGTALLGRSIATSYTRGFNIYAEGFGPVFNFLGRGSVLGVPIQIIIMLSVMVILQFVLKKTSFGRQIYLIGGNKNASYMSGIKVHRVKTICFIIAGVCAAITAMILTSRTTAASPRAGFGYEFDGFQGL